jgi:hypothetical protein
MLKTILMNQIRIMSALQRLDYKLNTTKIVYDLGQGINESIELLKGSNSTGLKE